MVTSTAVNPRKAARKRLGSFRGEGTTIRNPLSNKQTKPIRIDITPKKLVIENSISEPQSAVRVAGIYWHSISSRTMTAPCPRRDRRRTFEGDGVRLKTSQKPTWRSNNGTAAYGEFEPLTLAALAGWKGCKRSRNHQAKRWRSTRPSCFD